jgi:hypothetical protein
VLVFTACSPILTINISKIEQKEDSFRLKITTITNLDFIISAVIEGAKIIKAKFGKFYFRLYHYRRFNLEP